MLTKASHLRKAGIIPATDHQCELCGKSIATKHSLNQVRNVVDGEIYSFCIVTVDSYCSTSRRCTTRCL